MRVRFNKRKYERSREERYQGFKSENKAEYSKNNNNSNNYNNNNSNKIVYLEDNNVTNKVDIITPTTLTSPIGSNMLLTSSDPDSNCHAHYLQYKPSESFESLVVSVVHKKSSSSPAVATYMHLSPVPTSQQRPLALATGEGSSRLTVCVYLSEFVRTPLSCCNHCLNSLSSWPLSLPFVYKYVCAVLSSSSSLHTPAAVHEDVCDVDVALDHHSCSSVDDVPSDDICSFTVVSRDGDIATQIVVGDRSLAGCIPPCITELSVLTALNSESKKSIIANIIRNKLSTNEMDNVTAVDLGVGVKVLGSSVPLSITSLMNLEVLNVGDNRLMEIALCYVDKLVKPTLLSLVKNNLSRSMASVFRGSSSLSQKVLEGGVMKGCLRNTWFPLRSICAFLVDRVGDERITKSALFVGRMSGIFVDLTLLFPVLTDIKSANTGRLLFIFLVASRYTDASVSVSSTNPTLKPSMLPSIKPSSPSLRPSSHPTRRPSMRPSVSPSMPSRRPSTIPTKPPHDRQALCSMSVSILPLNTIYGWDCGKSKLSPAVYCSWYGVSCYKGEVIRLDLSSNSLNGTIPTAIGLLTSLEHFNLGTNSLAGAIPTTLGSLTSLTFLDLGFNSLTSSIPFSIGLISDLEYLDLGHNSMRSSLPTAIGYMIGLSALDLSWNRLIGPIPDIFGSIPNLAYIDLSYNYFTGSFPASFVSLSYLAVKSNLFTGSLPDSLILYGMLHLDIGNNQITGEIVNNLGSKLTYLDLSLAYLTGSFPDLSSTSNLVFLSLDSNSISQTLPSYIGLLTGLSRLTLSNNYLSGTIPSSICLLSNLIQLSLSRNDLVGSIPSCIGLLIDLSYLYLSQNSLTGSIPQSIGLLTDLRGLKLGSNSFSGSLPQSIGLLSSLTSLGVFSNSLSGAVPLSVCNMRSLKGFYYLPNPFSCEPVCSAVRSSRIPHCQYKDANKALHDLQMSLTVSNSLAKITTSSARTITQLSSQYINDAYAQSYSVSIASSVDLCYSTISICLNKNCSSALSAYSGMLSAHKKQLISEINSPNFYMIYKFRQQPSFSPPCDITAFSLVLTTTSLPPFGWSFQTLSDGSIDAPDLCNCIGYSCTSLWTGVICDLGVITAIDLSGKSLVGTLPSSIGFITSLTSLDLSGNRISGSLPSTMALLTSLISLIISSNRISGEIPTSITLLSNLDVMKLSGNSLRGPIPQSMRNLTSLSVIDFSNNQLTGSVPLFFSAMSSLLSLNLNGNMLSGEVPSELCTWLVSKSSRSFTILQNPHLTCYQESCWGTARIAIVYAFDPTLTMCVPTASPSTVPTSSPSSGPSVGPTMSPTRLPTGHPSGQPSSQPSAQPSYHPSGTPSTQPTGQPTLKPTGAPSSQPTQQPSAQPSNQPTSVPSGRPSVQPSNQPTVLPSTLPTGQPTMQPSDQPTTEPSNQPSIQPTSHPSGIPSSQPTAFPSIQPSIQPTGYPSGQPTSQPSGMPSTQPSGIPSNQPTNQPTTAPSPYPTKSPTTRPTTAEPTTASPTVIPSTVPTSKPSKAVVITVPQPPLLSPAQIILVSSTSAAVLLITICVTIYYLVFTKRAVNRRKKRERLRALPVHRKLLESKHFDVSTLIALIDEHRASAKERDLDGHTVIDLIVLKKIKIDVTVDVIGMLLFDCLPFNEDTGDPISDPEQYYGWTQAIQSDMDAVVEAVSQILLRFKSRIECLAHCTDDTGRKAVDIAGQRCKKAILIQLFLFGRFEIKEGPPEHKSATSLVLRAKDHYALLTTEDAQQAKIDAREVVLKFMRHQEQFLKEVQFRDNEKFDKKFVVPLWLTFGAADGDNETSIEDNRRFREDSILKGYSEYPFCIVMEAGSQSLKRLIDHECIAALDWNVIKDITRSLATSLEHIHGKGIVHCDLKQRQLKLIDLDASANFHRKELAGVKYSSGYMAPELLYMDENGQARVRQFVEVGTAFSDSGLIGAHPSQDMWSLGCILYYLSCARTLFHVDVEDNIAEPEEYSALLAWDTGFKDKKLSQIQEKLAKNLVSLLLNKNPMHRPDASHVLCHPFLTGQHVSRLQGDEAEWDVFLSYRVDSDSDHVAAFHKSLTEKGLKVWWDKICLIPGQNWEEGFCSGLVRSANFVCLLSRGAIRNPDKRWQNFEKLEATSSCDNVLLEWRLALELKERGMIEGVFPIMIGDKGADGKYSNYFRSGCKPTAPATHVESVEHKLREHLDRQGLGLPLENIQTVSSILGIVLSNQGSFLEGELALAIENISKTIVNTVNLSKTSGTSHSLPQSRKSSQRWAQVTRMALQDSRQKAEEDRKRLVLELAMSREEKAALQRRVTESAIESDAKAREITEKVRENEALRLLHEQKVREIAELRRLLVEMSSTLESTVVGGAEVNSHDDTVVVEDSESEAVDIEDIEMAMVYSATIR